MKRVIKLSIVLFLIITAITCFGCNIFKLDEDLNTEPEIPSGVAVINYVSLGDSIPDGVSLSGYNNKDSYGFVEGSYAYKFRNYLQNKYGSVSAVSYAESGQNSTQLLSSLKALNETDLTASEQEMKENIINANIITICIGANDILGPATSNLYDFFINESYDIIQLLDNGLSVFSINFPEIVTELETLNPTAQLIFSNIYNPYKKCFNKISNIIVKMASYPVFTIKKEKIDLMGRITEVYLNSGIVNVNNELKEINNGINDIIKDNIRDKDNCKLLNVRQSFDDFFIQETEDGEKIIQGTIAYLEEIIINGLSLDAEVVIGKIMPYFDPHPTAKGHDLILELLISAIEM